MAQEFRTTQYWGAGAEGEWFRDALETQKSDPRFDDSAMRFVRYAVKYCLTHDRTLKSRPSSYPGDNT